MKQTTQKVTAAEFEARWKRALADYQNLEKRVMTERSSFVRMATVGLIEKLLSAVDDLERAAAHIDDQGLTLVVNQFAALLKSEGVEEIPALGEVFDPTTMDCVEKGKGKPGVVITVTKKGYKIGDVIVRPASVVVGE